MNLILDPDTQRLAEFMQGTFPATKLIPLAEALAALAPILWKRYGREEFARDVKCRSYFGL
jgi:hypothetical protein